MKLTKIVATVSDSRCEPEFILKLKNAGVNVFRINSAHISREGFVRIVENIRSVDRSLAIMIDTKGPEVRTTATADGNSVIFKKGDTVRLATGPDVPTCASEIGFNFGGLPMLLSAGDRLIIDDGELSLRVVAGKGEEIRAAVEYDGKLGNRKTVNVPGIEVPLPAVSGRDMEFIRLAVEMGVDFIAHSFVRSAGDVDAVKAVLEELKSDIKIISKIENQQGINNFDSILESSYGIMIARGDLGIEIAAEKIPGMQIMMIEKCIACHKPVIVATQMLHSMMEHPRPTRAEVSDVAAAVSQRADAMMLSGETAVGKYPVEAVETMSRIAEEVERTISVKKEVPAMIDKEVSSFIARQAVLSETKVGTKAVITDSHHGQTARYISSFRGSDPTIAICYNHSVERFLSLSFGVFPQYFSPEDNDGKNNPAEAFKEIIRKKILPADARVAYISGNSTSATTLEIEKLETLAEGRCG